MQFWINKLTKKIKIILVKTLYKQNTNENPIYIYLIWSQDGKDKVTYQNCSFSISIFTLQYQILWSFQ
jgi:hypothetical protein